MSWAFTFALLNVILYVSYGVLVRYVYVLNKRMVMEDVEDRTVLTAARVVSFVVTGISVGVPIAMGYLPRTHIRSVYPLSFNSMISFNNMYNPCFSFMVLDNPGIMQTDHPPVLALTFLSVLVNVVTRIRIWRESRRIQAVDGEEAGQVS